ncbi:nucleoside recognition domain-containing protein [Desulforhopalus singaporensis]|nr:nucleoside recognition domain-containing protein [Desulforhopalus singaporensis]
MVSYPALHLCAGGKLLKMRVLGTRIVAWWQPLIKETAFASWTLIKIMVPVLIITRILEQFGLVGAVSSFLEPVMNLIGLPGELGLVWATAILTTLYGAMAVFATLAPGLELSVAQVTVLCSAMLVAHSLPIEVSISKKAGAPVVPIIVLRLGGAVVYCLLLHHFCIGAELWQQDAEIFWIGPPGNQGHLAWGVGQLMNLGLIVLVILGVLLIMRVLRAVGILGLMERLLAPVVSFLGMTRRAVSVVVVGMVMGLGIGGALIIKETGSGKLGKSEIVNSMVLISLCHSLVEDTLVMAALGGQLGGILWGRMVFSLIATFIIVQVAARLATAKIVSRSV